MTETNLTYTIETTNEVTEKGKLKSPTLIIHTSDGDRVISGINSMQYKFSKKGRAKGNHVTVNITVPGFVDGDPTVSSENFTLPQDLALVLKASDFWDNHGINLARPNTASAAQTVKATEAVSAP